MLSYLANFEFLVIKVNIHSVGEVFWVDPMDTTSENIDSSNKRERDRRYRDITKESIGFRDAEAPKKCRTVKHVRFQDEVDEENLERLVAEMAEVGLRPAYDLLKSAKEQGWIMNLDDHQRFAPHPRATRVMSDDDFAYFSAPYPAFSRLSIQQAEHLTDMGFARVLKRRSNMFAIDLSHCPKISDGTLFEVGINCPDLREFSLVKCPKISDRGVEVLVSQCTNLRWLSLDWCHGLSDASLFAIARHCPMLSGFCISEGTQFSLKAFKALLQGCQWLEKIDLWGCEQVTDAWIDAIIEWGPNLRELELKYCSKVTPDALYRLRARFGHIILIDP